MCENHWVTDFGPAMCQAVADSVSSLSASPAKCHSSGPNFAQPGPTLLWDVNADLNIVANFYNYHYQLKTLAIEKTACNIL